MDKKVEVILLYKKDKYKTALEMYGIFFIVNLYLFALNLVSGNVLGIVVGLFVCILMFYFAYDMLKKYCKKYNRKWFQINYQIICIITFVMFFLFPVEEIKGFKLMAVNIFVCYIVNEIFVASFNKKEVKDIFNEEQIKEVEDLK